MNGSGSMRANETMHRVDTFTTLHHNYCLSVQKRDEGRLLFGYLSASGMVFESSMGHLGVSVGRFNEAHLTNM